MMEYGSTLPSPTHSERIRAGPSGSEQVRADPLGMVGVRVNSDSFQVLKKKTSFLPIPSSFRPYSE
jgi:hypothetical protein